MRRPYKNGSIKRHVTSDGLGLIEREFAIVALGKVLTTTYMSGQRLYGRNRDITTDLLRLGCLISLLLFVLGLAATLFFLLYALLGPILGDCRCFGIGHDVSTSKE
jgi:hypothetical protein